VSPKSCGAAHASSPQRELWVKAPNRKSSGRSDRKTRRAKHFFRPVRGLIRLTTKPTVSPWATFVRHSVAAKANVVFCNGHVESPTLPFLFADTSDDALSLWNRDHLPHREKLNP
jgi:hypothetical protein